MISLTLMSGRSAQIAWSGGTFNPGHSSVDCQPAGGHLSDRLLMGAKAASNKLESPLPEGFRTFSEGPGRFALELSCPCSCTRKLSAVVWCTHRLFFSPKFWSRSTSEIRTAGYIPWGPYKVGIRPFSCNGTQSLLMINCQINWKGIGHVRRSSNILS